MDFSNLIDLYGQPIKINQISFSGYSGGKSVNASSLLEIEGILLNVKPKTIKNDESGMYEVGAKKLITKNSTDLGIGEINSEEIKCFIVDDLGEKLYKIVAADDLTGFANVKKFIANKVVDSDD